MSRIRRFVLLAHRYLGIALGLLFVLWFASGIAMIYAGGMPRLSPRERLEHLPVVDLSRVHITPTAAGARAALFGEPDRVTLLMVMGRPAYRISGSGEQQTVFADTGELLGEVTRTDALSVAARFMHAPATPARYLGELDEADQWTISERGQAPFHKIAIDDAARTELYVSGQSGEVVMKTTRGTRALAWVSAIPHWLYLAPLRLKSRLWARVVEWASGLAAVTAFLGLVLGLLQMRVRYASWMRWHYVTGVVFGVFALTWAMSGFLSMSPFRWFDAGSGGGRAIPQTLSGGALDLSLFPPIDPSAWAAALGGRAAKVIELRRIQGEPYFVVRTDDGAPTLVHAAPVAVRREAFSIESLVERIGDGYPDARVLDGQLLSRYDAYYYSRDGERPLPVVRVRFGDADGTWVYVDGTGQLVARFTRRQRIERWLYHGLHSLDFPFWYDRRPLWDVVMIALLLGGLALSGIGVVIGWKRLGKKQTGRRLSLPAR